MECGGDTEPYDVSVGFMLSFNFFCQLKVKGLDFIRGVGGEVDVQNPIHECKVEETWCI